MVFWTGFDAGSYFTAADRLFTGYYLRAFSFRGPVSSRQWQSGQSVSLFILFKMFRKLFVQNLAVRTGLSGLERQFIDNGLFVAGGGGL